ncbi:DUF4142 domain-containing protein [Streptomyces sp. XM83C]|jgi:predicted outer membrane protein|uniref:DUF4142 domain-containing protein n=1 Tax=unclassified Streptomyces TaxID=2593676 RepID=UPI001FF74D7D|nr:DUF4142 domain-containing protein [Streptomyces sp. XM83C]MCK1821491.1 DUF4142 domain-containing protein [Streptomyces sp. XM83C]
MRPRPPVPGRGIFSGTGLIIAGLTATLAALVFPIWSYADRSGTPAATLEAESVSTPYGPLSALDRDFIIKVRLAGLWELPAGGLALRKGGTDAVRVAGRHLIDGHTFLDQRVRDVAARLGLALPEKPTEQQRGWLDQLVREEGTQFDRTFANVLRTSHGRVFSLVAQVRAGTRNTLVRDLASDANTTVLDHIKVLEDTGLVDFDRMARDLAEAGAPQPTGAAVPPGPVPDAPSALPAEVGPTATASPFTDNGTNTGTSTDPGNPSPSFPLPPPAVGTPPSGAGGTND